MAFTNEKIWGQELWGVLNKKSVVLSVLSVCYEHPEVAAGSHRRTISDLNFRSFVVLKWLKSTRLQCH